MSFGDSKAVFEQRARAIGLDEAVVACFKDKSLDTMAKVCIQLQLLTWR